MKVDIEFIAPDNTLWTEADLAAKGDAVGENLRQLKPLYGRLVFESEDFGDDCAIVDDLEAVITQLCIRSVPSYAAARDVEYTMAADPGTATVRFAEGFVTVENEAGDDASDPQDGFAQSMLQTGERFLALKMALDGEEACTPLVEYLAQARAALGQ